MARRAQSEGPVSRRARAGRPRLRGNDLHPAAVPMDMTQSALSVATAVSRENIVPRAAAVAASASSHKKVKILQHNGWISPSGFSLLFYPACLKFPICYLGYFYI